MSREKQKANKLLSKKQDAIERTNQYGIKDLTPYNVVRSINGKTIVYK